MDKLFGHDCGRFMKDVIMEPSVVTGVPIQTGYRCPVCGNEVRNTGAYYQNERHKEITSDGFHWEPNEQGGWSLTNDS